MQGIEKAFEMGKREPFSNFLPVESSQTEKEREGLLFWLAYRVQGFRRQHPDRVVEHGAAVQVQVGPAASDVSRWAHEGRHDDGEQIWRPTYHFA